MRKKQKKKNKQEIKGPVFSSKSNQIALDQESLTEAIVKAYQIIEEQKVEKEVELAEKAKKEWQKIIGQKEYPDNEKWYIKRIHAVRNNLALLWKILFFKAENVKDLRTTLGLMRLLVIGIFSICKWCLYVISLAILYATFQKDAVVIINLIMAFTTWVFARLFRIASFEVEKIKDGNISIAIFSGCISFVAMVIAIITIFIGR